LNVRLGGNSPYILEREKGNTHFLQNRLLNPKTWERKKRSGAPTFTLSPSELEEGGRGGPTIERLDLHVQPPREKKKGEGRRERQGEKTPRVQNRNRSGEERKKEEREAMGLALE